MCRPNLDFAQMSIPASVVTTDAADEDAIVLVDDEIDVGFPESKRMRTATRISSLPGKSGRGIK